MRLRVVAYLSQPDRPAVALNRMVYLEYTTVDGKTEPGRECALWNTDVTTAAVRRLVATVGAAGIPVVYEPAANMEPGFKWPGWECPGLGRKGIAPPCCDNAGKYGGFPEDRKFTCPASCPCHD